MAEILLGNIKGEPGRDGENGVDGATFTPSVGSDGYLSWTNNKGLNNPAPAYVRGPQGAQGKNGSSGVYIGSDEPTEAGINVWIDPNGQGGAGLTDDIKSYIDQQLGVIENGSY